MKKVIIGIHGLGNKPAKKIEALWWKAAMIEGLIRVGKTPWLPKFELVYWSDLLYENPLDTSIEDSEAKLYLEEPYMAGLKTIPAMENQDVRMKVLEFVEYQLDKLILNDDYTINYSAIADIIVHRYFADLEAYYADRFTDSRGVNVRVRAKIRDRLAEVIKKYQGYEIMLVGHSMGSIIAYDVLTFLMPLQTIDWFVTIGSPLGFPIVQGKIAAEWKDAGMAMRKMKTPRGITKKWYNFADLRDRVAIIWKLHLNYRPNTYGVSPIDKAVVNDYSNGIEENAHKSYGYLRSEEFALALSEFTGVVSPLKRLFSRVSHRLS